MRTIEEIINKKYNTTEGVKYLYKMIQEKYPYLITSPENFETLSIGEISKEEFLSTALCGVYLARENKIKYFTAEDNDGNPVLKDGGKDVIISDDKLLETFIHEFIHMVTSKVEQKKDGTYEVNEGFNVRLIYPEGFVSLIPLGINEGITQMIALDILGKDYSDAYPLETNIAKKLALILGKEKLIKMYANHAKEELVSSLNRIDSSKDIMDLINDIYNVHMNISRNEDISIYGLGTRIESDLADLYLMSNQDKDEEYKDLLLTESLKGKIKNDVANKTDHDDCFIGVEEYIDDFNKSIEIRRNK